MKGLDGHLLLTAWWRFSSRLASAAGTRTQLCTKYNVNCLLDVVLELFRWRTHAGAPEADSGVDSHSSTSISVSTNILIIIIEGCSASADPSYYQLGNIFRYIGDRGPNAVIYSLAILPC